MSSLIPVQRLYLLRDSVLQVEQPFMTKPEDAALILRSCMRGALVETVWIMTLDVNDRMIGVTPLGEGENDHVDISLRKIFTRALAQDNAAGFVIAHNHPSGNAAPSKSDVAYMKLMRDEGRRLHCELKDFIIIGDGTGEYYSRRNEAYDL